MRVLVRPSSDLRALEGFEAERITGDLRDAASLDRALEGVQRVFHVAADYRLWARDPREIYESNVTGTQNLLEAARRAGVEKFVYTSTVATIAVPREGGLPNEATQSSLDEMIGHYKRSKFEAEQLRPARRGSGPAGGDRQSDHARGPGRLETHADGKDHRRFPEWPHAGLRGYGAELCSRGRLRARAICWPPSADASGERYILGGRNLTLKQMLDILAAISGRRAPRWKIPHALAYAAGCVDTAVSRLLGREPQIPLEGVRMARHKMFVDASKAERELGFARRAD